MVPLLLLGGLGMQHAWPLAVLIVQHVCCLGLCSVGLAHSTLKLPRRLRNAHGVCSTALPHAPLVPLCCCSVGLAGSMHGALAAPRWPRCASARSCCLGCCSVTLARSTHVGLSTQKEVSHGQPVCSDCCNMCCQCAANAAPWAANVQRNVPTPKISRQTTSKAQLNTTECFV